MEVNELMESVGKNLTFTITLSMKVKCNCSSLLAYDLNKFARDEVRISSHGEFTLFEMEARDRLVVGAILRFLENRLKEFRVSDITLEVNLDLKTIYGKCVAPLFGNGLMLTSTGWEYVTTNN